MKVKSFVINSSTREDSLFTTIIFFIIGIILFTNPEGIIDIIAYIFGSVLILNGLVRLFIHRMFSKQPGSNNGNLIKGIIYIVFGITSIIFFNYIETAFRITIAAYILYMGINRLIFAISLRKQTPDIRRPLALAALIIVFAILLAFLNFSLMIIGLFIIAYSIVEMITFIFYPNKKKDSNSSEIISEAIIVSEEKEIDENIKRIDSN